MQKGTKPCLHVLTYLSQGSKNAHNITILSLAQSYNTTDLISLTTPAPQKHANISLCSCTEITLCLKSKVHRHTLLILQLNYLHENSHSCSHTLKTISNTQTSYIFSLPCLLAHLTHVLTCRFSVPFNDFSVLMSVATHTQS